MTKAGRQSAVGLFNARPQSALNREVFAEVICQAVQPRVNGSAIRVTEVREVIIDESVGPG